MYSPHAQLANHIDLRRLPHPRSIHDQAYFLHFPSSALHHTCLIIITLYTSLSHLICLLSMFVIARCFLFKCFWLMALHPRPTCHGIRFESYTSPLSPVVIPRALFNSPFVLDCICLHACFVYAFHPPSSSDLSFTFCISLPNYTVAPLCFAQPPSSCFASRPKISTSSVGLCYYCPLLGPSSRLVFIL